jgi:hypothetical protein
MGERGAEVGADASGGGTFVRIEMHRGPRGLCVRLEGDPVAALRRMDGPQAISIAFFPPGRAGRRKLAYRVILAAVSKATGQYWVTYQAPGPPRPPSMGASPARVGALGMSDREVSILVRAPRLPAWASDPGATWKVSLR